MTIEALVRGRFHPLPGATARHLGGNAWEVRIPRGPETSRLFRRWELEALDSLQIALDGKEAVQVMGSGATTNELVATVLIG